MNSSLIMYLPTHILANLFEELNGRELDECQFFGYKVGLANLPHTLSFLRVRSVG